MKTRAEATPDKLRGGFYTPPALVDFCFQRLAALAPDGKPLTLLEPSAGDGAFIRGLANLNGSFGQRITSAVGVEPFEIEAEKARRALAEVGRNGTVVQASAVTWGIETEQEFDLAAGNPPFIRYQFVGPADTATIPALGEKLGVSFRGVSNLWIPVLLGALARIRSLGAFAFVIPTECFTGISAAVVRAWLLSNCDQLRFDLFAPGSFPGVLQEVTVMSGVRASGTNSIAIAEHTHAGGTRSWRHTVDRAAQTWTRYLLTPDQVEAVELAMALPLVKPMDSLVRFEVSVVTGANAFFSVDETTLKRHSLGRWAKPLLPRIRHAEGIVYNRADQAAVAASGARGWLLDFGPDSPDPLRRKGPREYLQYGESEGLHRRYKCRIRDPWFRVPSIRVGELLLSKRSHLFPRVVVNKAKALTTDTIYRGTRVAGSGCSCEELAASFHNSLTLLTAELEGRTFGGGVLELVPSEIARLRVPISAGFRSHLGRLDATYRSTSDETLIEQTDALLSSGGVVPSDLMAALAEARRELVDRRLARNRRSDSDPSQAELLEKAA